MVSLVSLTQDPVPVLVIEDDSEVNRILENDNRKDKLNEDLTLTQSRILPEEVLFISGLRIQNQKILRNSPNRIGIEKLLVRILM